MNLRLFPRSGPNKFPNVYDSISFCRGRKITAGVVLRHGSARRGRLLDAPARHPDAEASRGEYLARGRAQGTLGRPEGRDAGYGAPVRHVSVLHAFSFVYAERELYTRPGTARRRLI